MDKLDGGRDALLTRLNALADHRHEQLVAGLRDSEIGTVVSTTAQY
jgi:hypothetical protein